MKRWLRQAALQMAVSSLAVLLALLAGAVVIAALGRNPLSVYGALLQGTLLPDPRTGWYGLGQVSYKATTLCFTGVAVALSFRAGLFNIGAEGQLYLGGFAAALAGLYLLPGDLAGPWAAGICAAAAFLGGMAAAAIPAVLKAFRGAHEVIVTIMMNLVVIYVVNYLTGRMAVPGTVHTPELPAAALLPRLSALFGRSAANASVLAALAAAVWATYLLGGTRSGLEMRAVGWNPMAARAAGMPVRWVLCKTLLLSGGIAGLGGINFVLGNKGYFEKGFTAGAGYLGIAVALLARNHPLAAVPAAALFAVLSEGAVAVGASGPGSRVPREVFEILQAVVILFVIVGAVGLERGVRAWGARRQAREA